MSFNVPILFIVFNRPPETSRVFESIRELRPHKLYISSDGARLDQIADIEKCFQVRNIVQRVDWNCDIRYQFHEQNLGCSLGPRSALEWFFSNEEEGIVLEDDCLPSTDFFFFCREMLYRYRHDERILSINGCNLGYKLNTGYSYTFTRYMNMWGWATWRRSATSIDYSLSSWKIKTHPLLFLHRKLSGNLLDVDINWYKFWKQNFDKTTSGEKLTWWDWQWLFHQMEHEQLSIVPGVNLVTNIGFNAEATHTKAISNPASDIPAQKMKFPLVHPGKFKRDLAYEEYYVKWVWCYHKRLKLPNYIFERLKHFVKGS